MIPRRTTNSLYCIAGHKTICEKLSRNLHNADHFACIPERVKKKKLNDDDKKCNALHNQIQGV